MRDLSTQEVASVSGGTLCLLSLFLCKPKCSPKPKCPPKPRCEPKPSCDPKPSCGDDDTPPEDTGGPIG